MSAAYNPHLCDHYWLSRRGGVCRDCGKRFYGPHLNLSPGAQAINNARTPQEFLDAVLAVAKGGGK